MDAARWPRLPKRSLVFDDSAACYPIAVRGFARLCVVLASFLAGATAHANGRYPSAKNLQIGPGNRAEVFSMTTTFGLVYSLDGAQHWHWACENALGFDSTWDPMSAVTSDGAIVVTLPDGLSLSAPDACSFTRPPTAPMVEVVDLSADPASDVVVAAVAPVGQRNGVAISNDGGRSWQPGWMLDGLLINTIDIAPGHPQRIYLTGYAGSTPTLYRSDDGGMSFAVETADFRGGYDAFLAGVDPTNPDIVYVRSDTFNPMGTQLLRSTNGGMSFDVVTSTVNQPMTGIALGSDGHTLWIAAPGSYGVLRSDDFGATFQRLGTTFTPTCLRFQAGVLYACTSFLYDGYVLASSTDRGDHFCPVLSFSELSGPDGCAPGTPVHDQCQARWDMLRSQLMNDAGIPSCDASMSDGASLVDVPASDASHDGGIDGGAAMDALGAEPGPNLRGGCGCRTPRGAIEIRIGWIAIAGLVARRRRRPPN